MIMAINLKAAYPTGTKITFKRPGDVLPIDGVVIGHGRKSLSVFVGHGKVSVDRDDVFTPSASADAGGHALPEIMP